MTDGANYPEPSKSSGFKRWKRPLRLVVAAALLAVLFTQVPVSDVVAALKDVAAGPVVIAALLVALTQIVLAWRLKRLAAVNGSGLSLPRVLEINLTTRFYGLFVPGGNMAGTAIRFARLAAAQEHVAGTALALAVDRLLATLSLGLVGLAFFVLVAPPQGTPWLVALLGVTALCVVLMLPAIAGLRLPTIDKDGARRNVLRDRLPKFVLKTLRKTLNLARQTRRIPLTRLGEALGWSVLMHGIGAAAYWQLAVAMGLDLGLAEGGWARTAMLVATLLPITFAGIGLREGAAVVALAALGVSADQAVALALLCFVVTVLGPGVVGGLLEATRWLRIAPTTARQTAPA